MSDEYDDWDDTCDLNEEEEPKLKKGLSKERVPEQTIRSRTAKTARRPTLCRRYASEQAMNEALDWHLEPDHYYHCISQGDIDSLTYLRGVIKQQHCEYVLISTWCMAIADAEEIGRWISQGLVDRVDAYVGEIFTKQYPDCYEAMKTLTDVTKGRLCVFRNHSKVMIAYGDRFTATITSSANINTNPRCEQTVISTDPTVADFYKEFYDGITPFNTKDQSKEWRPWHR